MLRTHVQRCISPEGTADSGHSIHPKPGGAPPEDDLSGGVPGVAQETRHCVRRALLVGVRSTVPSGRVLVSHRVPNVETLGYSHSSLRDRVAIVYPRGCVHARRISKRPTSTPIGKLSRRTLCPCCRMSNPDR